MKKLSFLIVCFLFAFTVSAQEIINLVMVGNNGATENIKEAHSFIAVKKYPNGFQRLDYKFKQPLQKLRTYSDSTMTVLEGPYYEYALMGWLYKSGHYLNNMKAGDWRTYNDTGKVVLIEKYEQGVLIKTEDPDTIKKEKPAENKDDQEARFKKGNKDWMYYLTRNLDGNLAAKSFNGGIVKVAFRINTEGKAVDVFLRRSVEFILDEEALRVIEKSPLWNPAVQNGKQVNAYRIQPITFVKQ